MAEPISNSPKPISCIDVGDNNYSKRNEYIEIVTNGDGVDRDEMDKDEVLSESSTSKNDQPSLADTSSSTTTRSCSRQKKRNDVLNALQLQLEYYFSPGNLKKDAFLCSIMSSTQIVEETQTRNKTVGRHAPIATLIRFGKISNIFQTWQNCGSLRKAPEDITSLLVEAAMQSSELEVARIMVSNDYPIIQMGIGPKISLQLPYDPEFIDQQKDQLSPEIVNISEKQSERNTIILRDMPSDATTEEVRSIFSWENCPDVKSLNMDVGNCWFVTFSSTEEEVISTLLYLKKCTFRGEPIMARLKTKKLLNSNAPVYSPEVGKINLERNLQISQHPTSLVVNKRNNGNSKFSGSTSSNTTFKKKNNEQLHKNNVTCKAPPLGESHFPALGNNIPQQEKTLLDSKGTAGGYAAALLKPSLPSKTNDINTDAGVSTHSQKKLVVIEGTKSPNGKTLDTFCNSTNVENKIITPKLHTKNPEENSAPPVCSLSEETLETCLDDNSCKSSFCSSSQKSYVNSDRDKLALASSLSPSPVGKKIPKVSFPDSCTHKGWGNRRSFADILKQSKSTILNGKES